jgi:DNA-binding NarL/FixJ family response regulator
VSTRVPPDESRRPTVFLVDDHAMVRSGVRAELGGAVDVVGEAADVDGAVEGIRAAVPDVVLLDVHVGADDGLELLDEIETLDLPTRVVLLSGTSEIGGALRERVDVVLGKPFDLKRLAAAVVGVVAR